MASRRGLRWQQRTFSLMHHLDVKLEEPRKEPSYTCLALQHSLSSSGGLLLRLQDGSCDIWCLRWLWGFKHANDLMPYIRGRRAALCRRWSRTTPPGWRRVGCGGESWIVGLTGEPATRTYELVPTYSLRSDLFYILEKIDKLVLHLLVY